MSGGITRTHRLRLAIAAAVLGLSVPAVAGAAVPPPFGIVPANAPPSTPLKKLGSQLYAGNCATCHGPNGMGFRQAKPGRGSGGILGKAPSLRGMGELAADFYLRTGRMPLGRVGDQPLRGRVFFSDHQIRALVAYVGSLGPGPPIPHPHPERGRINRGLVLFTDHCAGCHQIVAQGGYLPGALVPPLNQATPVQIAQAVRIGPYVMPTFSKKSITDKELDDIIAYVEYAKSPHDEGGWALGHIGPIPEGLVTWLIAAAGLVAVCVLLGKRLKA